MPASTATATLEDDHVVARVLAGELALFEVLMRRYNQRLFRITRAILRSDADAEDAVQQAYVSAYTALPKFEGAARFATWLTRIAVNEALGRLRRRTRQAEVDLEEAGDVMSGTGDPEEHATRRAEAVVLERAIDALPDPYRVVFVAREVQQLSVAETAEALSLTEENVKVRLHRARAMLREALYQRVEERAPAAFSFLGARCDRIVAAVMARLRGG